MLKAAVLATVLLAPAGAMAQQAGLTEQERRAIDDVIGVILDQAGAEDQETAGGGKSKPRGDERRGGPRGVGPHSEDVPPGLARRGTLPPGLQKHLDETGQLPPGLQKRLTGELGARLPGRSVKVTGDDVVVTDATTGQVVQIIRDILDLGGRLGGQPQ